MDDRNSTGDREPMSALRDFDVGADGRALYLLPRGIAGGAGLPGGRALAGGDLRFGMVELICRTPAASGRSRIDRVPCPVDVLASRVDRLPAATAAAVEAGLHRLTAPRAPLAGLAMNRPHLMGVVNVTPDSFSDGGDHPTASLALALARKMHADGAAIVDIGGESTRPGADAVPVDVELARVRPVIEGLAAFRAAAAVSPLVSIDSRHAAVMRVAVAAGADIINDVTALRHDPDSLAVAATADVPVMLMHMRGAPETMQRDPSYDSAPLDIFDHLAERIAACEDAGIPRARLAVDPGIGFGKTVAHNLEVLDHLALYHGLGCPILLGASRKSFIARLSRGEPARERLTGSVAAALAGLARGVQILRVHDVAETRQAMAVWCAVNGIPLAPLPRATPWP